MTFPRPRKNCPYCGSFNLKVKPWRSRGTWFVACECTATGAEGMSAVTMVD